jgi:two-component system, NtrC family, sensor kinase
MRRLVILLFTIIIGTCGFAQSKYTDSLSIELSKANDDTGRVLILANLSYYHRYQNLDTAQVYGKQSLALAQKINFERGESIAYQSIAVLYRLTGDYAKALELLFKSLKIAEENNFLSEKAYCLMRIAIVYYDLQEFEKSITITHNSLQTPGLEKRTRVNALNYLNLGQVYEKSGRLDSAWFYGAKAYENLDLVGDLKADICRTLGNIKVKTGDRASALLYYNESIDAAENLKDFRAGSFAYAELAKVYRTERLLDSSIYYASRGLEYAQKTSNKRGVLACAGLLAEIYEDSNPAEAFRFFRIASEAKEGLFGAGNLQAIQALVEKEEERKNEIEFAEAAYQAQLKQYGLLAGLGVFLMIAIILYRNNLIRKKSNQLLQNQKSEIEMQKKNVEHALADLKSTQAQLIQSEKMASLGELTAGIAHEIQNPLNFVNNFSEVSSELIGELVEEVDKGNTEEVKLIAKDVQQNLEKINHHGKRADAIVKGMLQHSSSGSGVKEPTDINALVDEYLRLVYHGLRARDKSFNATINTEFDETIGNINIIPQDMGRVILNLINNAFYACNERSRSVVNEKSNQNITGYEPTVSVSTKIDGSKVLIAVKDNGNGIPQKIFDKIFQPFFTTKPTGQGTGLGLSLSYEIVKAHGGELKVETKEGKGTVFMIVLPV